MGFFFPPRMSFPLLCVYPRDSNSILNKHSVALHVYSSIYYNLLSL